MLLLSTNEQKSKDGGCKAFYTKTGSAKVHLHELGTHTCRPTVYLGCYVQSARVAVGATICIWCMCKQGTEDWAWRSWALWSPKTLGWVHRHSSTGKWADLP